jgi:RNA polymerase sigma-70 factor (ECF subfamily)
VRFFAEFAGLPVQPLVWKRKENGALMTDGELVRQALAGGVSAREELARRWSPRVLAMCQARVERHAAEDLAQDSLVRALRSLAQLDSPERFGPWIRSIAIRTCVDWHRRRRIMERNWSSLPEQAQHQAQPAIHSPTTSIEDEEDRERLWRAVSNLPDDQREVLLLFYCESQSYDAAADLLEVSRATVNSRLAKARDTLRRHLNPDRERDHGLFQRS